MLLTDRLTNTALSSRRIWLWANIGPLTLVHNIFSDSNFICFVSVNIHIVLKMFIGVWLAWTVHKNVHGIIHYVHDFAITCMAHIWYNYPPFQFTTYYTNIQPIESKTESSRGREEMWSFFDNLTENWTEGQTDLQSYSFLF